MKPKKELSEHDEMNDFANDLSATGEWPIGDPQGDPPFIDDEDDKAIRRFRKRARRLRGLAQSPASRTIDLLCSFDALQKWAIRAGNINVSGIEALIRADMRVELVFQLGQLASGTRIFLLTYL